jgi:predicted HD phosphohydrolase
MRQAAELSVDEIVAVLATGAARTLGPGVPVTQLEHALQTATALRRDEPDDPELAVAGLVHDLGQLLPGARDETHADEGAAAVRSALGERVAGIVALHVEAKRYLVATDSNYKVRLAGDSVVSLGRQGGALDASEAADFLRQTWAADAVTLRRADDGGKADGLVVGGQAVGGLEGWVPLLRQVSELSGRGGRPRNERAD